MKLKVTREGGFAAQVIQKHIDSKKLPPKLQHSLASFVEDHPVDSIITHPQLRDGYLYTVQWAGETNGKIQFDDLNIPKEIGPIIHYVLK